MATKNGIKPSETRRLPVIDDPSQHQYYVSGHASDIRAGIIAARALLIVEQETVEESDELSAAAVLLDRYVTELMALAEEIDEAFTMFRAKHTGASNG